MQYCLFVFLTSFTTGIFTIANFVNSELTVQDNQQNNETALETTQLHDSSQGKLIKLNNDTLSLILDFDNNGIEPNSHFWVGTGSFQSGQRSPVPVENLSKAGRNITIALPDRLTAEVIDWLSICCGVNGSELYFPLAKSRAPKPQIFGLKAEATSGPIVLVNRRTLYVPNLHFDNVYGDVRFCIGRGQWPSTAENVPLTDETGSMRNIRSYSGESVYLRLPEGATLDIAGYFGLWSATENRSLGFALLNRAAPAPDEGYGYEERTRDGRIIVRLPKCCPFGAALSLDGCEEDATGAPFEPTFAVLEHNATHVSSEGLPPSALSFEPFVYATECPAGKYPLDPASEDFAILANGSLVVRSSSLTGILSQGQFCLENVEIDDNYTINALVCAPEAATFVHAAFFHIYLTATIISTMCLILTVFLFHFVLKVQDIHKKCFSYYSLSMCISFICLSIVQMVQLEANGCKVIGFVFQFSIVSSYTWLTILCFDIFFIILYFSDDTRHGVRFYFYAAISAALPLLSVLASLRNLTPDVPDTFFKPQFGRSVCRFEDDDNLRRLLFYIPISLMVCVSCVILVYTKIRIAKADKRVDYFWLTNGTIYKFMFRQCYFTLIITTICWAAEIMVQIFNEFNNISYALVIIEALQGIFIVAIFTAHHYGTVYLNSKKDGNDVTELNHLHQ